MNEIKTWQERTVNSPPETLLISIETFRFMQAEIDELRAALKERGAPEPVAWRVSHTASYTGRPECRVTELFDYLPLNKYFACSNPVTEALYLHPPTVREPLSDAEIIKIAQDNLAADPGRDGYILPIKFAHAIEAAHGIKS